jgi:membrane-associated phospholipid phosphatase
MTFVVNSITHLGDSVLVIPASVLLVSYLAYRRLVGHARLWFETLALCGLATLALKAVLFACGTQLSWPALHSPSGHTSLSVTFYGCAALMASADKTRAMQLATLVAGAGIALAVAITRILLQVHSTSEVLMGLMIGGVCVAWFGRRFFVLRPVNLPWPALIATLAILALATHGVHWNFEWLASRLASLLRSTAAICS